MPPGHACVILAFVRAITEITPPIDYLLGRTTADSQLQAPAGDQIRSAGIFGHIVRILIAHVDYCGANFDISCLSTDCGKERERRRQLPRKVMNAKVRSIYPQTLGLNSEVNGLQKRVGRRSRL